MFVLYVAIRQACKFDGSICRINAETKLRLESRLTRSLPHMRDGQIGYRRHVFVTLCKMYLLFVFITFQMCISKNLQYTAEQKYEKHAMVCGAHFRLC